MKKKQLIHLPLTLLQEIYEFIIGNIYNTPYYLENNAKIWRNLMNINKEAFHEYRPLTIVLSLNTYHSMMFLQNEQFRDIVLSRITDRKKQLGFIIKQNEAFMQQDLELINPCSHIIIRGLQIKNLSFIKHVKKVEIFDCPKVTDVSCLGSVEEVILFNCFGIRDITGLGTVKRLSFFNCNNIEKGFQSLHQVTKLNINHGRLETTFGMENIQELLLTCSHLKDIPLPLKAKKVSIHSSDAIRNVMNLCNVADVSLTHCYSLESVNNLTSTKMLSISSCQISELIDLSQLTQLISLHLGFCNIESLTIPNDCKLEKLTISSCRKLSKVLIQKSLLLVSIFACKNLQEISSSSRIGSLEVRYHIGSGPQIKIKGGVDKLFFLPLQY